MRAFFIIFFLFQGIVAISQEKPFFREYYLNRYLLNPAVAGSGNCTMAHLTDHHQWLDVSNAPMSQTLSLHGSLATPTDSKHGWGAIFYNDVNGPHKKTGGQVSYAYHIQINEMENAHLSFGLSAAFYQYVLDESSLNPYTANDPLISGSKQKTIMPNVNAGIYYYSNSLFGGISAANLLPEGIVLQEAYLQPELKPVYAAMAGYRFGDDKRGMAFEPSAALILKNNFEKNININARVMFPFLWLGVAYKHNLDSRLEMDASIAPILGININNFFFAYSHQLGLGELQSNHYGSPHIKLGLRICREKKTQVGAVPACPAYW